jgi:hypothetical protein
MTLAERIAAYLTSRQLQVSKDFPKGQGGIVIKTTRDSVVKAAADELRYRRERDCYLRLAECELVTLVVDENTTLNLPELLDHDDDLWVIEMTMVGTPYLLDFASAQLDVPFDFDEEAWHERLVLWHGDRVWDAYAVRDMMAGFDIYYLSDLNPGNLRFPEYDADSRAT